VRIPDQTHREVDTHRLGRFYGRDPFVEFDRVEVESHSHDIGVISRLHVGDAGAVER
jgi:hypothetical protein